MKPKIIQQAAAIMLTLAIGYEITACNGKSSLSDATGFTAFPETEIITQAEPLQQEENCGGSPSSEDSTTLIAPISPQTLPEHGTLRSTLSASPSQPASAQLYPYGGYQYGNLTAAQQVAYMQMEQAARLMQVGLIDAGACTESDLYAAFLAVQHDHPEYFWLTRAFQYRKDGSRYQFAFALEHSRTCCYPVTVAKQMQMQSQLEQAVRKAMTVVRTGMSDYQKELALHRYLTQQVSYDAAAAIEAQNKGYSNAFTAYGALVEGKAVCEGYARAFSLLLNRAGITNTLVGGTLVDSGVAHLWNMVKVEESWYHVDATLNDTSDGGYHLYFNVSSRFIAADHSTAPPFSAATKETLHQGQFGLFVPAANDMKWNWAVQQKTYFAKELSKTSVFQNALKQALFRGQSSVEFVYDETDPMRFGAAMQEEAQSLLNDFLEIHPAFQGRSVMISGIRQGKGFCLRF